MLHLLKGKTLNQAQAARLFGAWRLSALIFNLRKKGFDIVTTQNSKGIYKGFGTYHMTKTPNGKKVKAS
jgi:hypothetical protein|tara:strand:- start:6281 stop:6487 length:207 start_codon:yes stop_codon:yes gene_type:complete